MNRDTSLYKQLMTLALPIMGANFLQTLYNLADTFFLGRLGREAVSAPGISFHIILFLVVFGTGFSMAATTVISQWRGRGDQQRVDYYATQIFSIMVVFSLIITIVGYFGTETILRLIQVPDDIFPHVFIYLRIIFLGMPFMFIAFILKGILQGVGNGMTPLRIQLVTIILNVILDPLLIFGWGPVPAFGVAGAAAATIFARFVSSAAGLVILVRGRHGVRLRREYLIPRIKAIKVLGNIGMPIAVGQGISSLGFLVMQGVVNTLGVSVIAVFGIGSRIIQVFNMPAMGFSQATAVMVGQSLGAKRPDQAQQVVRQSILTIMLFMGAGMTIVFFSGETLVSWFIADSRVISLGKVMFQIQAVAVMFYTLFMVLNGAFQGGGYSRPIMMLNIFRLWGIRVPLAYAAVTLLGRGEVSIWVAMLVSNIITASISLIIYRKGKWISHLDIEST